MANVAAHHVLDYAHAEKPGDFFLTSGVDDKGRRRLTFRCPCGCSEIGAILFKPGLDAPGWWGWNGNEEKPTVTPSIRFMTGCRWHGHLEGGVFRPCEDSGRPA